MKITLISLVFPPETGSARRVGELAFSLAQNGHQVCVITGFPNYPLGIIFGGYKKSAFLRETWQEKVEIYRVNLYTSPKRKGFFHRLLHYLSFTFTSFLGGMKAPRPDVVYVVSPPYFLGLSGWLLAKLRGARLAFDVQDLWPEAPISLGYIKNRYAIVFLQTLEKFIYQHSHIIFTLSDKMKEKIEERGVPSTKIETVYNWVDLEKFAPNVDVHLKTQCDLHDRFVILFAGNMGQAQGLVSVIEAAVELQNKPEICFVLLGEGIEKPHLMELAQSRGLRNVMFLEAVPEDDVPRYLGMADVLLVTLGRAKHREAAIPSKIQVYMSSSKPLLVAAEGAASQIVVHARCGLVVPPDQPQQLAQAVLRFKNMPHQEREQLGMNGRIYAEKYFDRDIQCKQISDALIKINPPINTFAKI